MAKKRARRRSKRTLGIALYIITMVSVITVVAFYQRSMQTSKPSKKPVNEYFVFSDGFATASSNDPQNNTILINTITFNVTAIGGNATNVFIYVKQGAVPEEEMPFFSNITQGQTVSVGPIFYTYDVPASREEGKGWGPLNFKLICNEAEGDFSIYVTEWLPISL
jgi:hypothetical protein